MPRRTRPGTRKILVAIPTEVADAAEAKRRAECKTWNVILTRLLAEYAGVTPTRAAKGNPSPTKPRMVELPAVGTPERHAIDGTPIHVRPEPPPPAPSPTPEGPMRIMTADEIMEMARRGG